jgi:hypothetical protein
MAEQEEQQSNQSQTATSSGSSGAAVKAAAAAAATGVAALAAKKALSGRHQSNGQSGGENGSSTQSGGSDSIVSSMISGSWEAAREQILPLAEEAAGAAGEFVARNAPDVVKERIVPRFISSFNEASG